MHDVYSVLVALSTSPGMLVSREDWNCLTYGTSTLVLTLWVHSHWTATGPRALVQFCEVFYFNFFLSRTFLISEKLCAYTADELITLKI